MFKRVLLCYDGSESGRRALKRGAELAILVGAQVHVLSIVPSTVTEAMSLAHASGHSCGVDVELGYRQMLQESIDWLKARGVGSEGYLARGNTLEEIVAYAKRLDVDLIVVGHYPHAPGGRWWSGPQRASLAERAPCCVLIAVSSANDAGTPAAA